MNSWIARDVEPSLPYAHHPFGSAYANMSEKSGQPYAERGKRLRRRKEQLIETGILPDDLGKIAELVGVSVSGFQQWERGETWPRKVKRAKLADVMRWSEQELDFGPQEAKGSADMSSHPVSPEELEVLALYRGLEDQRAEARTWLIAKLHTRHALQHEVRGPLKAVADSQVDRHIPARPKAKTKR